ncbi:hypothetical protein ABZ851_05830 [Streptomyces sp. NPDC047049]|uniref:hypothetical protein n=1 Tax=Streptomyces sp. NPDC047049 TaxID=3156688 RepID=UPI0033D5CE8F
MPRSGPRIRAARGAPVPFFACFPFFPRFPFFARFAQKAFVEGVTLTGVKG